MMNDYNSKRHSIKDTIRSEALALGFDLFGVAPLIPLKKRKAEAKQWLDSGYAAGMRDWFDRDLHLRFDPSKALDDARALIMLGVSYAQPPFNLSHISGKPEGRIARFAQGMDYHIVLPNMLDELVKRIKNIVASHKQMELNYRYFVDSGPLAEKQYAALAGLGFIGRNGLLIHPEHGSWFYLCGLLINIYLPPDTPLETTSCGDCDLCVQACPAGALSTNMSSMNASRCLSYWTVETREEFPDNIRKAIDNRLFGCDTCQEVCPYNKNPLPCRLEAFSTSSPSASDEIIGINATLDSLTKLKNNREFNQKVARSPLSRCRMNGMKRNLKVVAQNLGRKDIIAKLDE